VEFRELQWVEVGDAVGDGYSSWEFWFVVGFGNLGSQSFFLRGLESGIHKVIMEKKYLQNKHIKA
jgi:hypothetical protein